MNRILIAVVAAVSAFAAGPAYGESSTHPASESPVGPVGVVRGDQIPWDQVGPGWSLAALDQGINEFGLITADHQLLDLVNPEGGRYQLLETTIESGHGWFRLEDWSADGRVALLLFDEGTHRQRAVALDLRTGRQRTVAARRSGSLALRPDGHGFFGLSYGGQGAASRRLVSYTWAGDRQVLRRGMGSSMLLSTDGRSIVTGATTFRGRALRVLDAQGQLLRRLTTPTSCHPVRWWAEGVVLASCWARRSTTRLYAVPLDGSGATPVTTYRGRHSTDLGDLDAYELDGQLYLQGSGPCGYLFLARQEVDGSATTVDVPGAVGNVLLLGTRGGDLLLQHQVTCDGGTTRSVLSLFDPESSIEQVLTILPVDEAFGRILQYGERRAVGY